MPGGAMRWTVFRVSLDPVVGSEQAGSRPGLVVSREVINEALPIVAILPLTTRRPGRRIYSTEVVVPAGAAGQPEESIVMAHQVRTVSARRLGQPYGVLEDPELRSKIQQALRTYFDLD